MEATRVAEKVLEQTKLFRAALPNLIESNRGKWVVFMDGQVASIHDDETAAYAHAVETFGTHGGYVIAPVVEANPTPVTAAVAFGLSFA